MINKHSWIDILWTYIRVAGNTRKISVLALDETYSYQPFLLCLTVIGSLLLNANTVCSVPNVMSHSLSIILLNLHYNMQYFTNLL